MTFLPDHILKLMSKADRKALGKAGKTKAEIEIQNDNRNEKAIHDDIESYLRRNGLPYDHCRMDKKSTNKIGQPDYSIYLQNRVLFLEVKRPGGKLSQGQEKRIAELEARGNTVKVCYSYDQAKAFIKEFEEGLKNETK